MRLRPPTPTMLGGGLVLALAATLAPAGAQAATAVPAALPSAVTTTPDPLVPVPATGTLPVIGKGFGHGRGMSQYGAAGAATLGRTWQQITSFYYPGTVAATTSVSRLRVGLADSIGTGLAVTATAGVTASDGTTTLTLPTTDATATTTLPGATTPTPLAPSAVVRWEITPDPAGTGTRVEAARADGVRVVLATTTARWSLTSGTGRFQVIPSNGTSAKTYLGTLSAVRSGSSVSGVLTTKVDDYVRMVVPAEAIPSWPTQALAAQAVAARSYALSSLGSTRTPDYDVCSSTRCQVLGSITAESTGTRAAVAATAGIVLTRNGVPVRTEFSSSNGGWTADGGVAFLPAQADPYDRTALNPVGSWRADVPVTALAAAYPALGRITGIQVLTRDGNGAFGGRVLTARVVGTNGEKVVTGAALRTALGSSAIRSTYLAPVTASRSGSASASSVTSLRATGAAAVLGVSKGVVTTSGGFVLPSSTPVRLATVAGEWDAQPGNDVLGVTSDGVLRLWSGTATGFAAPRDVATGMSDVSAMFVMDDLNGDRQHDLVVRRGDGRLYRLDADGRGGVLRGSTVVGSGWTGVPSVFSARVLGTGREDMVARLGDGTVVAYPTTGRDTFRTRVTLGSLPGYRSITSTGDLTGDGRDDIVALDTAGTLWLVPVTADLRLGARVRLGDSAGATSLL